MWNEISWPPVDDAGALIPAVIAWQCTDPDHDMEDSSEAWSTAVLGLTVGGRGWGWCREHPPRWKHGMIQDPDAVVEGRKDRPVSLPVSLMAVLAERGRLLNELAALPTVDGIRLDLPKVPVLLEGDLIGHFVDEGGWYGYVPA